MKQLGVRSRPGDLLPSSSRKLLIGPGKQQQQKQTPTLKRVATAVRFVVRCQMAARFWAKHERTRQRLAEAVDERERTRRMKRMRDEWRAQMRMALPAAEA